jgi:hypothetical protein
MALTFMLFFESRSQNSYKKGIATLILQDEQLGPEEVCGTWLKYCSSQPPAPLWLL